jgi:hypothetical protein
MKGKTEANEELRYECPYTISELLKDLNFLRTSYKFHMLRTHPEEW